MVEDIKKPWFVGTVKQNERNKQTKEGDQT